jgi:hypothetical protein
MDSQRGRKKWRGMDTSDLKREIIELQEYTEGNRAGRETHAQSCGELQVRRSIFVLLIVPCSRLDSHQQPERMNINTRLALIRRVIQGCR